MFAQRDYFVNGSPLVLPFFFNVIVLFVVADKEVVRAGSQIGTVNIATWLSARQLHHGLYL